MNSSLTKAVNRLLEWTLIVLMGASVLNVLWQVFTRFVIQNPSSYTEEMARFLLIWVGLLAAAYGVGTRSHLAIDLLPMKLEGRRRQWLEIWIQVSVFVFALFIMVVGGFRLVTTMLYLEQTSAALGLKLGYVYLVLPISGILILYYATIHVLDARRGMIPSDTTVVQDDKSHPID